MGERKPVLELVGDLILNTNDEQVFLPLDTFKRFKGELQQIDPYLVSDAGLIVGGYLNYRFMGKAVCALPRKNALPHFPMP